MSANNNHSVDQEARRQRLVTLRRKGKAVQEAGDRARISRDGETTARNERHRLEDLESDFAHASTLEWIESAIALAFPVGVYLIDFSIFASLADHLSRLMGTTGAAKMAVRLLVPLVVLVADLWLGRCFWRARRRALREPATRPEYRRWALAACVFVVLMPIAAGAPAIAALSTASTTPIRQLLTIEGLVVVILALILHAGIILGASRIERAWAFFLFRRRHAHVARAEAVYHAAYELNERDMWELFIDYDSELKAFNHEFGDELTPGPFDRFTSNLINARVGRKIVDISEEEQVPA